MVNYPRPLKIIAQETFGVSYSTHRYCFDSDSSPDHFYEKEKDFTFQNYGETDKLKKSVDVSSIADKLKTPLFSYDHNFQLGRLISIC
jgi:hypothetical protein